MRKIFIALFLSLSSSVVYSQITLPYLENFEDAVDSIYSANTTNIAGVPNFGYTTDNVAGRLEVREMSYYGGKVMILHRASGRNYLSNELVLTLDMSSYTISDDIIMDFSFISRSPLDVDDNEIKVRGSDADDWVLLYDWYEERGANGVLKNEIAVDISTSLDSDGQDFSDSFQISFGEYGGWTFPNGGLGLDDIYIYERPLHDIRAVSLEIPKASSELGAAEIITIGVTNFGSSIENSVPLVVNINGAVNQDVTEYLTSINPGDTVYYSFTQDIDLSSIGTYKIEAFVAMSIDEYRTYDTLSSYTNKRDKYVGTLPYSQGFDTMTDTIFADTGYFPGMLGSGLSYERTGRFDNYIFPTAGVNTTLEVAMGGLSESGSGSYAENYVYLTIDLSEFDKSLDDILLDFDYGYIHNHSVIIDVDFRGSESEDWLPIFGRNTDNRYDFSFVWEEEDYLSLSEVMLPTSQNFTQNSQIRIFAHHEPSAYNGNYGFDNIKVHRRPDHDLRLVSLEVPDFRSDLSNSESVILAIYNFGDDEAVNVPVSVEIDDAIVQSFQRTITETIDPEDTILYEITGVDFSLLGSYDINVFLEYVQDEDRSNDTLTSIVQKIDRYTGELPYFEKFINVDDTVYNAPTPKVGGLEGFSFYNSAPNGILEFPSGSFSDDRFLRLSRNTGRGYARNDLIFTIDLSDYSVTEDNIFLDANMAFSAYNAYRSANNKVLIRGDEDQDWLELFNWKDELRANYTPFQLTHHSISDTLRNHAQEFSLNTQLKFIEGTDGYSPSFRIDDIKVWKKPEHDIQLISLDIPEDKLIYSPNELMRVGLLNYGEESIENVPLTISIIDPLGDETQIEVLAEGIFMSNDTSYFDYNVINFDISGYYEVSVFSRLAVDEDRTNDTIRSIGAKYEIYQDDLPFFEGFEKAVDQYYITNVAVIDTVEGFHFETEPAGRMGINHFNARSGDKSVTLGRKHLTQSPVQTNLILSIDLSAFSVSSDDILFDFSVRRTQSSKDELDYNKVYIRSTPNDDWIELYDWLNNYEGTDWMDIRDLSITDTLSAHGMDYSEYFQIRISEYSSFSNVRYTAFDDFRIHRKPDTDIQVISVDKPFQGRALSEKIEVSIRNYGTDDLSEVPLSIKVDTQDSSYVISEVLNTAILSGDTLTYVFIHDFDFTTPVLYDITATSGLLTDQVISNDTAYTSFESIAVYREGLPYSEDFEQVTYGTTHIGKQLDVDSLSGFSFESRYYIGSRPYPINSAELSISSMGYYEHGNQSLKVYPAAVGNSQENELTLTIDLSMYMVDSDQILFDCQYSQKNVDGSEENKFYLRGSELDPWLELYDWNENMPNYGTWQDINRLSLSDTLQKYGQNFTSSTQIMVSLDETRNSSLFLDGIKVYRQHEIDLQLISAELPKNGMLFSEATSITVMNFGIEPVFNFQVTGELTDPNGDVQNIEESYIGTLNTYDTTTLIIQGFDMTVPGAYELILYSSLEPDGAHGNDTLRYRLQGVDRDEFDLFWHESFENLPDSSFAKALSAIPGVNGFSIDGKELDFYLDTLGVSDFVYLGRDTLASSGNYSLRLGENESGVKVRNELLLSLNMSDYSSELDNLFLDFACYFESGYPSFSSFSEERLNAIFIRSDRNSEWIRLFNWYDFMRYRRDRWEKFDRINLSNVLNENGADFSETTQLLFTFYDRGEENKVLFDDIKIYSALTGLNSASSYRVGEDHFVAHGNSEKGYNEMFYKYDPITNEFYPEGEFPISPRIESVSFILEDQEYLGLGMDAEYNELSDFYKLDSLDGWVQLADFPGEARSSAVSFVLDEKAYIGTGSGENGQLDDFWMYDSSVDEWSELVGFTGEKRTGAIAFVIEGKAYVSGGVHYDGGTIVMSDMQVFDPATTTWSELDNGNQLFSGSDALALVLGKKAYMAYGSRGEIIEYNPATGEVSSLGDVFSLDDNGIGSVRAGAISFVANDTIHFGLGSSGFIPTNYHNEVFKYFIENNEPTDIVISNSDIPENSSPNYMIGTINIVDSDEGDFHSILLQNTLDNENFYLVGNELYSLKPYDFESIRAVNVSIEAYDRFDELISKTIRLTISNLNEAPIGNSEEETFELSENSPYNTIIGELYFDDPEGASLTYSIESGDDLNAFGVTNSGVLYVRDGSLLNYELQVSYALKVNVSDDNEVIIKPIIVQLIDENETPVTTGITFNVDENSNVGTLVGDIDWHDPEGEMLSFEIIGNNADVFDIEIDQIRVKGNLDYESLKVYHLRIVVRDGVNEATGVITIDVNNVNEDPSILGDDFFFTGPVENGFVVGTIETSDPDEDTLSFEIIGGDEKNGFSIDAESQLIVNDITAIDFVNEPVYELRIQVSDDKGGENNAIFNVAIEYVFVLALNSTNLTTQIYPNPFIDEIFISDSRRISYVQLSDLTGKAVLSYRVSPKKMVHIDTRELRNGVYLLSVIYSNTETQTVRLIKNNGIN